MKTSGGSTAAFRDRRIGSGTTSALPILWLCIGFGSALSAPSEAPTQAPEIISLFPLGAGRDSVFHSQVRGKNLQGVYGVWFSQPGLQGEVSRIEDILIEEKKGLRGDVQTVPGQKVFLEIRVDREVETGRYLLRLVSPRGTSNALRFVVVGGSVVLEMPGDRRTPEQAQLLRPPAVVNGRIGQLGEVDFYAVDVHSRRELNLHALSNTDVSGFDAIRLTLHRAEGSWFDPERPLRLAFAPDALLFYRCDTSGHYLIEVGAALGIGGPSLSYQLSVSASQEPVSFPEIETILPPTPLAKIQQPFQRNLAPDRLELLQARTVPQIEFLPAKALDRSAPGGGGAPALVEGPLPDCHTLAESEPNEIAEQAPEIALPVLLEGAIERPGDVDVFRFAVEPQTRLAFELETPEAVPPAFNPHLSVLDADGEEVLTNYYRKIAGDGDDWVKLIQAKTLYTFEQGGEYRLQIRDITPRYGNPRFRYRVMIRPQVPHVGEIEVAPEVVHLSPGEAGKVTIITLQEEGFQGEVAFDLDGLPAGVHALPGADVEPDTEPPLPEIHKERFVPKSQKTTIVLVAEGEAPLTRMPTRVRLQARPVVEGKVGQPLAAGEILVMVRTPPASDSQPGTEDPS